MIEEIKLDSLAKLFDFIVQNPIGKHPIMNFTYRGHYEINFQYYYLFAKVLQLKARHLYLRYFFYLN